MALTATYKKGYCSTIYRNRNDKSIPSHAEEMCHRFNSTAPTSQNVTWNLRWTPDKWETTQKMITKYAKQIVTEDGLIFEFSDGSRMEINNNNIARVLYPPKEISCSICGGDVDARFVLSQEKFDKLPEIEKEYYTIDTGGSCVCSICRINSELMRAEGY